MTLSSVNVRVVANMSTLPTVHIRTQHRPRHKIHRLVLHFELGLVGALDEDGESRAFAQAWPTIFELHALGTRALHLNQVSPLDFLGFGLLAFLCFPNATACRLRELSFL